MGIHWVYATKIGISCGQNGLHNQQYDGGCDGGVPWRIQVSDKFNQAVGKPHVKLSDTGVFVYNQWGFGIFALPGINMYIYIYISLSLSICLSIFVCDILIYIRTLRLMFKKCLH